MRVAQAPSFDPTIYPFQLILTLSTSTPPSTLTLPRHQRNLKEEANAPPDRRQPESIQPKDIKASRAHAGNGTGPEVANPSEIINVTQTNVNGLKNQLDFPLPRETLNSTAPHSILNFRVPVFQNKLIYKRGQFKWATTFGQGPISLPPFSPSDAHLSEGDVFLWIDTASSAPIAETVKAWCSFTTASTTHLIWKRMTVFVDIRVIDGVQYVLSLRKNLEPSWILVRSAHPHMKLKSKQQHQSPKASDQTF